MFTKQTIKDMDLGNKTVLLRADYNVPLENGKVADDYRIQKSIPTVEYLLSQNVRLIICSHLGRPDGKVEPKESLAPVADRLGELLGKKVNFVSDCIGPKVKKAAAELGQGEILLLENLRFHAEEEANDKTFARQLASLAEVFVEDGFGVVHRAHASTVGVTHFLPSIAGFLLEKEVDTITNVMEKPERPLMAIVGGAKVKDKIEILKRFITIADFVAIGGALANPFLVAEGYDVAESLLDPEEVKVAKEIMTQAKQEKAKRPFVFAVPFDVVVADKIDKGAKTRIVDLSSNIFADIMHYPAPVPHHDTHLLKHEKVLDIGPFSASYIAGAIQLTKTAIWNGTMGVTETDSLDGPIGPFAHSTEIIIEALVGDIGNKPFSVVGGGDTVGYVEERKLVSGFNHVSTGGGASLDLMSGYKLPGLEALMDKKEYNNG